MHSPIKYTGLISFRIRFETEDLGVYIEVLPPDCEDYEDDYWEYFHVNSRIGILNCSNSKGAKYRSFTGPFSSEAPRSGFNQFMDENKLQHFLGPNNELILRAWVSPQVYKRGA
eukprot:GHVO01045595.1.p1 GENE.GHVO01045595.1~~GHVO01045595.1.p1  ORF type:complete len:114 (-),score=2.82 GHVO01045595.1:100-441(-)